VLTRYSLCGIIITEREVNKMDYEKALEILIELMIENKDVLLRLKEGKLKEEESEEEE
jgi:hypothetical protein